MAFGLAAAYPIISTRNWKMGTREKRVSYLLGSSLLLGLLYRSIDLLFCLLDNLFSFGSWCLLGRGLCDASRGNSFRAWLGGVGLGRLFRCGRLCNSFDLSWNGDAGLRSGLGASGGGRGHFVRLMRNLMVRYESVVLATMLVRCFRVREVVVVMRRAAIFAIDDCDERETRREFEIVDNRKRNRFDKTRKDALDRREYNAITTAQYEAGCGQCDCTRQRVQRGDDVFRAR